MEQSFYSESELTSNELQLIQKNRLFSAIARSVQTTRSQGKKTVSAKYVKMVLRGQTDTISETTANIKKVAKQLVSNLNNYENELN